ncbi:heterokaryon incompatibility protein-domain-containing protein [Apodospora peruviana]|uniref:Heterokaryon incompatibility protein-domain-containing protein n=1 Tax=Apodospora peruviana TaxID=516989 RepID=A0AAE0LZ63_9PEZI|nr:heterokaryon incompatibility protein-domain-containing protein [Apodospora peruviana]
MFSPEEESDDPYGATGIEEEEEDEQDRLSPLAEAITFFITTFVITVCGDYMVASLGETQATETIAGTIILPIITGGAEILRSVMAAIRGETTPAILFSLSLALQVLVLDAPLLGIASLTIKDSDPFELVFTIEEAAAITIALITSLTILQRGKANYVDGCMLTCLNLFMVLMLCSRIDTKSLELMEVADVQQPYAILSHRWEADEVSFEDFQIPSKRKGQAGFKKIKLACKQALDEGYAFAWVDRCCINKSSSAELSEAINSIFNWYHGAVVCYAYLSDAEDTGTTFSPSQWFECVWALQELIAVSKVVFYSSNWTKLGEKATMTARLGGIAGISDGILGGTKSLQAVSVAERMSWAAYRRTTRPEDVAYWSTASSSDNNSTMNKKLLMGLNCHRLREETQILGIELVSRGGDQYLRSSPHELFSCSPSGSTTTVYVAKYAANSKIDPVRQVLPTSAKFSQTQHLVLIGDWCVCIILWALRVERIQTYEALFDVVLTSKDGTDVAISAVKRPSRLLDERVVSFGTGKPYLAVALEPTVVRGFDLFAIRVELSLADVTERADYA